MLSPIMMTIAFLLFAVEMYRTGALMKNKGRWILIGSSIGCAIYTGAIYFWEFLFPHDGIFLSNFARPGTFLFVVSVTICLIFMHITIQRRG